jgi:hypothetical protein
LRSKSNPIRRSDQTWRSVKEASRRKARLPVKEARRPVKEARRPVKEAIRRKARRRKTRRSVKEARRPVKEARRRKAVRPVKEARRPVKEARRRKARKTLSKEAKECWSEKSQRRHQRGKLQKNLSSLRRRLQKNRRIQRRKERRIQRRKEQRSQRRKERRSQSRFSIQERKSQRWACRALLLRRLLNASLRTRIPRSFRRHNPRDLALALDSTSSLPDPGRYPVTSSHYDPNSYWAREISCRADPKVCRLLVRAPLGGRGLLPRKVHLAKALTSPSSSRVLV